jgi:hypothetical protein
VLPVTLINAPEDMADLAITALMSNEAQANCKAASRAPKMRPCENRMSEMPTR